MSKSKRGMSDSALGIGAVAAMAVCCAGPVLIAAGALGVVAGFLTNPVVLAVAVAALVLVVAGVARRRSTGDTCCPPEASSPDGREVRSGPAG